MTDIVPTEADRICAADVLDEIASLIQDDGIGQVADLIRDGEYDEHDTVQRIARHAASARKETLEEAAKHFDTMPATARAFTNADIAAAILQSIERGE